MKIKGRKTWWALIWPDGTLGIDADDQMYLYKTKKRAQAVADHDFDAPCPRPIKLVLGVGDGKLYLREVNY